MIAPDTALSTTFAPPLAFVVDPVASIRLFATAVLSSIGFHVITAETFDDGRQLLGRRPPAVLVSSLKLGEYNGLHLVLRARATAPRVAALVLSDDPMFRREAQQAGATFVVTPVTADELKAAVLRTMFRTDDRTLIEAPFERRTAERRRIASEHLPNRRMHDRRRDIDTLIQVASLG